MAKKGTSLNVFLPIIMCFNMTMVDLNNDFYAARGSYGSSFIIEEIVSAQYGDSLDL